MLVAGLALKAAEGGARLSRPLVGEEDWEVELMTGLASELFEHVVGVDRRSAFA